MLSAATILVHVWLAEARWLAPRDHAAQAHVLARYAERSGVSLETAADRLVWPYSRPPAWVREVGPDCERTESWPGRLRWSAHAELCRELFERAAAFLAGRLADPCRGRPDGWRSKGKALRRALRRGYERVWCGRGLVVAYVVAR